MAPQQKTIVISDLHISNGAEYSWFVPPYPDSLTRLLNQIAKDSEVGELILLGDVFDLWLYPIHVVPWTVDRIIQQNQSVADALRQCVRKIPNVYYMNGNHDMGVVEKDLQQLSVDGKGIELISPDWYNAKYQGRRHLEHGHAVDMFNAPDGSDDAVDGYPLGFFITRLVATASVQNEVWWALRKLCQAFGALHKAVQPEAGAVPAMHSALVEGIIYALAKVARVDDKTRIRFSEPSLDNQYTVGDIKSHYGSLYRTWRMRFSDPEEFLSAMLVSLIRDGLGWYAKKLLLQTPSPKCVVMGHTHNSQADGGYDNDGSWCVSASLGHGDAHSSYVEIVGDTAQLIPWK